MSTALKQTPADVVVRPRNLRFDVAPSVSASPSGHWMGGDPVATAVFNALSLTFPDGEKMFIDAVKHFRPQIQESKLHEAGKIKLLGEVQGFIAQEGIHAREHAGLNRLLDRERYPVAEIEEMIRKRIAMARDRGPFAMLLSTIALEHFTAMMAEDHMAHPELFDGVAPDIERMWRWHAMEETEHKAVAFDVFMEVTKHWSPFLRWRRRTLSMMIVTWNFTRNIAKYASMLLEAEGWSPEAAAKAVKGYLWGKPGMFRRGWRTYFAWYRPGFHPWDVDNRAELAGWKAEYDQAAAKAA
jgi:predicted metal-dependent hydrolase